MSGEEGSAQPTSWNKKYGEGNIRVENLQSVRLVDNQVCGEDRFPSGPGKARNEVRLNVYR